MAILSSNAALACDTPVYRYAMYRWQPAEYEVYHFHQGEVDPAVAAMQAKLLAARDHETTPLNINFQLVNVADDPDLKDVPRDVRELRQKHGAAPLTLVVNPAGIEVFHGQLDEKQYDSLTASPLRAKLAELLAAGNAGVFVLVTGKDAELNVIAQEAATKLVADVHSGKISLYRKPDAYDPLSPALDEPAESTTENPKTANEQGGAKPAHSVATLTFTRAELAAQDPWLLKCLMAVEGDLRDFQDEPLLFVVYGRGRALPPFIGKGITYNNLVDVTDFITGACSCTVKEQNPGVDLLLAYDWEAAAAAVAKKFGSEEGSESLADLFPQLLAQAVSSEEPPEEATPSDDAGSPPSTLTDSSANSPDDAQPSSPAAPTNSEATPVDPSARPNDSDVATEVDSAVVERNEVLAKIDVRYAARPSEQPAAPPATSASLVMLTLGASLGIGFFVLLAVTFFVLKP